MMALREEADFDVVVEVVGLRWFLVLVVEECWLVGGSY